MKVGQIGPTFVVPGKTVIFLGVKSVIPSSTLKIIKCHNKLACEYAMCIRNNRINELGFYIEFQLLCRQDLKMSKVTCAIKLCESP